MLIRKPYVGGNWKMNLNLVEAQALAKGLVDGFKHADKTEVVVCPPFPYLTAVGAILKGSSIKLGAQDCYFQSNGAYTGEVSVAQLKDVGVQVVLCGHSERRHVIGETDVLVNAKVRAVLAAGLEAILCVGEKLDQRQAGYTDSINAAQTYFGLAGVKKEQMDRVTIAYEPVWAIGGPKPATEEDAQSAHVHIRQVLSEMYGLQVASAARIQYGGAVKPDNAVGLFKQPDIDGGLIGGASLKADQFLPILNAAAGV